MLRVTRLGKHAMYRTYLLPLAATTIAAAAATAAAPPDWVPERWAEAASRSGLIWAAGGVETWRSPAPWRGDPDTTSRAAQFGNGYAAGVVGGPEYVAPASCNGNRAPILATYNVSVVGMSVVAMAQDMERGMVEQLWCPTPACATSVLQTIYAHEALPHAIVTELVANNSVGTSPLTIAVAAAPQQPAKSTVGGHFKGAHPAPCMDWKWHGAARGGAAGYEVMVGVLSEQQKKGGNISLAVSSTPRSLPALTAAAGKFSAALILPSSRYSSADAPNADPATAVVAEMASLLSDSGTLRQRHQAAYAKRGRNTAPISLCARPLQLRPPPLA
jgi:hypothetical protein